MPGTAATELSEACEVTRAALNEAAKANPGGGLIGFGDIGKLRTRKPAPGESGESVQCAGSCSRAIPGHIAKMYAVAGLENELPLYRVGAKDDLFGAQDKICGPGGIVYKMALREAAGAFTDKTPSADGLPAYKAKGKKKEPKEGAPPPYARPAIPAQTCAAMLATIRSYAEANNIPADKLYTVPSATLIQSYAESQCKRQRVGPHPDDCYDGDEEGNHDEDDYECPYDLLVASMSCAGRL